MKVLVVGKKKTKQVKRSGEREGTMQDCVKSVKEERKGGRERRCEEGRKIQETTKRVFEVGF